MFDISDKAIRYVLNYMLVRNNGYKIIRNLDAILPNHYLYHADTTIRKYRITTKFSVNLLRTSYNLGQTIGNTR